jgi:hypothetical protein
MNELVLFGDAKYFINSARQERLRLPSRMPREEEIQKLQSSTVNTIQNIVKDYEFITKTEFVKLRNATCSRLTL